MTVMLENLSITTILIAAVVILFSISVHEFMHAFVAFKLGDDTAAEKGRVSLNPLKHIDPLMTVALPLLTFILFSAPILAAKPVPFDPDRVKFGDYGAAMIAFAGPLSNIVLAVIGAFASHYILGAGEIVTTFIAVFITLNVGLFVFNLIPIPPLDGSRVLYAFAPDSVRNFMNSIEPFGLLVVFALILLPGFGDLISNINAQVLQLLP